MYGDAKNDLVRSLERFDKSLQDVGLLTVLRILSGQEGFFPVCCQFSDGFS